MHDNIKGAGALWFSLGPSTIVEDRVTSVVYNHLSGDYKGIISAALSGVCAALCVASQTEYIITTSHSRGITMIESLQTIYAAKGLTGILLPPGMVAMVGREIPFASALFYFRPLLSQFVNSQFPTEKDKIQLNLPRELLCGCLTSFVATPLSHPASVIASYQQGHSVSPQVAIKEIIRSDGHKGFLRGIAARTCSLAGTFTVVPILLHLFSPSFPEHPQ